MKKMYRVLSFVLLFVVLFTTIAPANLVYAENSATKMGSQMISFFQNSGNIDEVSTLTKEEIRTYMVFITNFMKPGIFNLSDLKGGKDSELVGSIKKFLGNSDLDAETIVKINTLIYDGLYADLSKPTKCVLYANQNTTTPLTGMDLFGKMLMKIPEGKNSEATSIYYGEDKMLCMDFTSPAIQGTFKILAAYSVDFMLSKDGLCNMEKLYIDGYGNIWGAFKDTYSNGGIKRATTTATEDLVLVMPACINPLAFTSFAGVGKVSQENLKLPLANAFAMGSFVNIDSIRNSYGGAFEKNIAPYYNIFNYYTNKDMDKILNIFGFTTPLDFGDSTNNYLKSDSYTKNFSAKLDSFFKGEALKKGGSTYIKLANNLKIVNDDLSTKLQDFVSDKELRKSLLTYLFSTLTVSIDNVADTMYYFGSEGNVSWSDTTFSDLGLVGADMFLDSSDTFYSSSTVQNGVTLLLDDYFTALNQQGINLSNISESSLSFDNIDAIITAAEILRDTVNSNKKYSNGLDSSVAFKDLPSVTVSAKVGTYILTNFLAVYTNKDNDGDMHSEDVYNTYANRDDIVKKAINGGAWDKALKDKKGNLLKDEDNILTDTFNVSNVNPYISAVLFLTGLSKGEYVSSASPEIHRVNRVPKALSVGAIKNSTEEDTKEANRAESSEVHNGIGTMDADTDSYFDVTTNKFLFIELDDAKYIYALDNTYDGVLKNVLIENYSVSKLEEKITNTNIAQGMFGATSVYTLFGTHSMSLSSTVKNNTVKRLNENNETICEFKTNTFIADDANNWPGIFWGYMVDILQMKVASDNATAEADDGKNHFDCYAFETTYLPTATILSSGSKLDITQGVTESGVSMSDEQSLKQMQEDMLKKVYGILSTSSNSYRDSWIKSTVNGVILSLHRGITGSWLSNMYSVSSGGGSGYQSVTGYIYTPTLTDLPFTAWFMNNYMMIYALLLLFVSVLLVMMVLLNNRTWQQAVGIFSIMTVVLLLPNILLSNTINITNQIVDSMYANKFDFWAMTQHQQSLNKLSSANNVKEEIILSTFDKAQSLYSSDAGVRIKWMSPKKSGTFNELYTNTNMSEAFATNLTVFKWLFSSFIYESEYVNDDPLASYLYRPYNSIANAGKSAYSMGIESLSESVIASKKRTISFVNKENKSSQTKTTVNEVVYDVYTKAKSSERGNFSKMFYASLVDDNVFTKQNNFSGVYYGSDIESGKFSDISKVKPYNPDSLENTVAFWGMASPDILNVMFKEAELFKMTDSGEIDDPSKVGITSNLLEQIPKTMNVEEGSKITFLLNTESPYYYFYNTLKYRYGAGSFKKSLLNPDVFKVSGVNLESSGASVNGKIRDFLDMESLFTYLIPYMTACNDYVYSWTNINGTSVEGYDFNNGIGNSNEYRFANAKKQALGNVWNMYSPWVDQINNLDIGNVKVPSGTKSIRIENALNPSYYLLAGREMVFSEADMIAHGLNASNLTSIERRIQDVLDATYKDLMYLVNYYDMDDEVLLSAAAMYATFNFNKEFSQASFLGDSVTLYPQNFEMKNFNHDAFLRLALLNSTGETIFSSTDIFETVLDKTSWITGIIMLVEDILAQIVIPTLKLLVLLLLLFLGFLVCLVCVVQPPDKMLKMISKTFIVPTILYMVSTTVFGVLVSILIGDGLTAYVGNRGISITTNDPTITLLLLVGAGGIYTFVLFKLVLMLFKSCKEFAGTSLLAAFALASGTVSGALSGVAKRVTRAGRTVGGAAMGGIMNGKDGIIDGAISGSQGQSLGSMYSANKRAKRGARQFADAMGANSDMNIKESIDAKASSNANDTVKAGLFAGGSTPTNGNDTKVPGKTRPNLLVSSVRNKEPKAVKGAIGIGTKDSNGKEQNIKRIKDLPIGNTIGDRVMDASYVKAKVQDSINAASTNLKRAKNKVVYGAKMTLEGTKQTAGSVVDGTKKAANIVASGVKNAPQNVKTYANKSIVALNNMGKKVGRDVADGVDMVGRQHKYAEAVYARQRNSNQVSRDKKVQEEQDKYTEMLDRKREEGAEKKARRTTPSEKLNASDIVDTKTGSVIHQMRANRG